ncbi:MAG: hypothetical protein IPL39_17975 [Opitutaceae bacterium]|nr:hypothetical protein [Opitutaceae bacterium]
MLADFPFPEGMDTLRAQIVLLRQRRKAAVYIPHWSPQLPLLCEFPMEATPAGSVIYDPAKLTPAQIHAAVATGKLGAILGYGIDSKPDDGDRAVTLLDGDTEVVAVFSTAETEARVREALALFANPGDEIRTEAPAEVSRRRIRWWTHHIPT